MINRVVAVPERIRFSDPNPFGRAVADRRQTMCGIAGIFNPKLNLSGEHLAHQARTMADSLSHRGPDDEGVWADSGNGIALAHRRLSIIDLSSHGRQPMESLDGRYIIVFNGEIYNFRTLRKDLEEFRWTFRGHSDTEVLLAALGQWGLKGALDRANGMFAFALWDRKDGTLHLVRDRLGEKPLYYGMWNGALLFASELKALKRFPGFSPPVDRNVLSLYLRYNYVPSPFSIYEGVFKLPPGTSLTLRDKDLVSLPEPLPYWSVRESSSGKKRGPEFRDEAGWINYMEDLLRDSVRIRMVSDVPLGAFLSGGIDSSAVVALMQEESSIPVRTFTIGFREEEFNEAEAAKKVARHLRTDHTELYVSPEEAMAVIPKIPTLYDEPFSDSSQIPTFLVSQLARRHVTVCLSGDGGDEVFGGYNRYVWAERIWNAVGWMPGGMKSLTEKTLTAVSPQAWNRMFDKLAHILPERMRYPNPGDKIHKLSEILTARNRVEIYRRLVSQWKEPEEVVLNSREPGTVNWETGALLETESFAGLMMLLDLQTYLPDDILVKVDRATMGVGLEGRIPYLDHRIVEASRLIPEEMKFRRGTSKWILRKILSRHVPPALFDRPKSGFGAPIGDWLRGPLREWAESLLDERRLEKEGYFNPGPIRKKWEEHLSGARNWQYHLWAILMFQEWLASA